MKTLKSIALGLALLISANLVKADDVEKLTKDHAVNTYVEAITHGKLEGLSQVLDNSVKFNMVRGKKVLSFSKNEMLGSLQENKNATQNCSVNTSTVENNGEVAIVKVELAYEGFTRCNLVTVSNTGNGWKITNVTTTYK